MQKVKILNSFFHTTGWGAPVETFKGGQVYAVDEHSMRQVALQNAVLVDVADEPVSDPVAGESESEAPAKARKGKGA